MIFLLDMEPLHMLFKKAQDNGLLDIVSKSCENFRVSLYTDDVAVFIKPSRHDMQVVNCILQLFQQASGLATNMDKTQFFPIHCNDIDLTFLSSSNLSISSFPYKYLGLPLHFKKLPKSYYQVMVQKVANRLPGWKKNLLTYPGREMLAKTVLSALPTFFLTMLKRTGL
jgi:hypothetical protein